MGLLGRKNRGPDAAIGFEVRTWGYRQPYPCHVGWVGELELLPYVPGAYLDKILANLTHSRFEAAGLCERVWDHLTKVIDAVEAQPNDAAAAFQQHARAGRVEIFEASPDLPGTPQRIVTDIYVNVGHQRLGAITHFKDGANNPQSAERGFWALWDWCCAVQRNGGWQVMPKQLSALMEQLAIYNNAGTPGVREIGRAPYQVFYAYESAGAPSN